MGRWIDLDKTPKKVMVILDIIVIVLLICSTYFLYQEIYLVKKYSGQCVNDPMGWAEYYAWEEKGERIYCSCNYATGGISRGRIINFSKINLTEE